MKKILVVCNDAGGAEVVSSWVRSQAGNHSFAFLLRGPAVQIFERKIPGIEILSESSAFAKLSGFDLVLTGTGWVSDLEKVAIKKANTSNIDSVAYLDHWMEYRSRFELDGELNLPGEIWVGDIYAQQMAEEVFPNSRVKLVPNLYLQEIADEIMQLSESRPASGLHILYVSEPTSVVAEKKHGDARYYGYSEFEAFENYLQYLVDNAINVGKIRLRTHPTEPGGKYQPVIEKFNACFTLEESRGNSLIEDCAWADWVVGCQSMAMVIAVMAQKQVFSCIPRGGAKLLLPFPEIHRLNHD